REGSKPSGAPGWAAADQRPSSRCSAPTYTTIATAVVSHSGTSAGRAIPKTPAPSSGKPSRPMTTNSSAASWKAAWLARGRRPESPADDEHADQDQGEEQRSTGEPQRVEQEREQRARRRQDDRVLQDLEQRRTAERGPHDEQGQRGRGRGGGAGDPTDSRLHS